MFCKKCGKELRDNARYCSNCGTDVTQFEEQTKQSGVLEKFNETQPLKAISAQMAGILSWFIMILMAPLEEYEAKIYWDSVKPAIFILIGFAGILWSNKLFKEYLKMHTLEGIGKKCYRLTRILLFLGKILLALSVAIAILELVISNYSQKSF